MNTLEEMRARLVEIEDELRALHTEVGEAALNEEQQTRWDELDTEHADVSRQIAEAEEAERCAQEEIARRRDRVASFSARSGATEHGDGAVRGVPQIMQRVEPFDGRAVRSLTRMEARDRALKLVEGKDNTRHLNDDQLAKVDRVLRTQTGDLDGSKVSRLMLLTENDDYRSAFVKMVTQPNPVLTTDEARAMNDAAEFRAMSGGTDASGGFGVPILIDPAIILTAQGSLNPFRRLARTETITTDEWRGVSSAGVTWSYDPEASEVSDDSPTLAQPVVHVHEARGWIPFSIRVGQDYPGFASEMSDLLMSGYDELQAQSFATGSGSGQPFGILTALDANAAVEVAVTTDGTFTGTDINKVWGALPDRYKANATWVMNYDVANEVASFANANNWSFFTVDLTGQIEQIRNRPVAFSSYFPDFTGTTGASNILVVGDFRNYLIVDRVGMSVELVPHVFGTTNNRPTGERGWFAYARHGADSINDLGFRLLQNT